MNPGKFNSYINLIYLPLLIFLFSCQKKEVSYFEKIAFNDEALKNPTPEEWRYNKKEHNQTFQDFQKLKKIKPEEERIQFIFSQSVNLIFYRRSKLS